ncbi:MAG: Na/Pi cotransporter family protein [Eubacteriales bacterium]|nr:Na/Pi cotransporter family protein [Eubacteriales bacterium]MDY2932617.1 Na/Pi cotransporter family protein [Anaerovoracaceae bacterium]
MNIFDFLSLIGGLALFLFGMQVMGNALEKKAGGQLNTVLGKITDNPIKGFGLGLGITSIVQSSSATTVMLVGLVNSEIITLKQSIYVIMGANVGTTVTAWLLSLTGISGDSVIVQLLKPSSFTPVLALIGIIFYMFVKNTEKKDTGMILLGFAVLMYGMESMSGAVSGLKEVEGFTNLLTVFSNPILGVLAGALLTAIIQSSSASVGILQALSTTGAITYASAIPIIMGQNIGTCVTALISSIGANKNAKRVAFVHLYFNIIGTVALLLLFYAVNSFVHFAFVDLQANQFGIAITHSMFNLLCTALLLPFGAGLGKLATLTIKDAPTKEEATLLDERLLITPSVALERAEAVTADMADAAVSSIKTAMPLLNIYDAPTAKKVRKYEKDADVYEDAIGSYLVKLSNEDISETENHKITKLLKLIGDFERISDHAVNIVESAEEINSKHIEFSDEAKHEVSILKEAVFEITDLAYGAFIDNDLDKASLVEPLEQTIDILVEQIKLHHILRLQKSECTIDHGFVLSDILTNLERTADHCSNIAACITEISENASFDMHKYLGDIRNDTDEFKSNFKMYKNKYSL